jgi:hypothetical protein
MIHYIGVKNLLNNNHAYEKRESRDHAHDIVDRVVQRHKGYLGFDHFGPRQNARFGSKHRTNLTNHLGLVLWMRESGAPYVASRSSDLWK